MRGMRNCDSLEACGLRVLHCQVPTAAYLSRGDVGSHRNDLADRLVAEDSGEWSGQMSERLMDVGVADAAGMHLHEHLIRSGLRLRNVFDLPRTANSGNDGGLHNTSS